MCPQIFCQEGSPSGGMTGVPETSMPCIQGIVKQFRGMAFRIAHVLRTHQDDDETPHPGLQRQPGPTPDQLSPNTKPSWLAAPATAAPVHASGTAAPIEAGAPGMERSAAPAPALAAEAVLEGAQPSGAVPAEMDHGGQAKARFSRVGLNTAIVLASTAMISYLDETILPVEVPLQLLHVQCAEEQPLLCW